MPLYEYRCAAGHVTERVQSMHDPIPESVPCRVAGWEHCTATAKRVFNAPIAHYKGAGFYTNDYKGKYDRKRRPNPGDDLPVPEAAHIGRAEGAEYDPPRKAA